MRNDVHGSLCAPRIAAVMSGQVDFTVVTEPGKIKGEKAGLKAIMDMAKLNIPFQFTCTVTTGRMIRDNPNDVMDLVKAMTEAVHYYKNNKEQVIKIMQKYTRGQTRGVLDKTYKAYSELFVVDTVPTVEGLKNTFQIQASWDSKATKERCQERCQASLC